jgi:polysaccharide biosynthesis protein PslH
MRNRILFLSQCLPFPPHSGVMNRTYHILQHLQREFDVTLVPFSRRGHQADATSRSAATNALREEVAHVEPPASIESDWSGLTRVIDHLKSVVSREPYTYYEYGNPAFRRTLDNAIKRSPPDLVHLDSLDLYRWLPFLPSVPTACTHHNIESELLRLPADHVRIPGLGAYVRHQADLVEKIERRLSPRFDLNVLTSKRDEGRLRALAPQARTMVVPNGVDIQFFSPSSPDLEVPGRVVFLGPTYMFPNRDAVEFFLDSIWPSVLESCPEATFHTVGKNSAGQKARFESKPRTSAIGYVSDIRPAFAEAECSVVPLRVGGGTRLKILDAWSMGKAIVSTSIGCEGLETLDGVNMLIRDEPREFAAAVVDVLRNGELRARLEREGRHTAETHYAWSVVGARLSAAYHELIDAGSS